MTKNSESLKGGDANHNASHALFAIGQPLLELGHRSGEAGGDLSRGEVQNLRRLGGAVAFDAAQGEYAVGDLGQARRPELVHGLLNAASLLRTLEDIEHVGRRGREAGQRHGREVGSEADPPPP